MNSDDKFWAVVVICGAVVLCVLAITDSMKPYPAPAPVAATQPEK